jgi:hypothetical protein
MRRAAATAALATAVLFAQTPASRPVDAKTALRKGFAYLLGDQNADGSWGGPRNKTMTDGFANYETHRAWTVGTTGLVVHALIEAEPVVGEAAVARGVDALVAASTDLKRCADWDIDNVWGYVYGLQGAARALRETPPAATARRAALTDAAKRFVKGLADYQSPNGGWGYYADSDAAWRPNWATSFTTAAAVLALKDAEAVGISVPGPVSREAAKAVDRARLPSGAFAYDIRPLPRPGGLESIDDVRASLGRMQVCGLARIAAGRDVPVAERREAVAAFFKQHVYLDCALKKPVPHESWYANAAYFYLFGHYYAARMIATLPAEERAAAFEKLVPAVVKTQEADGGMWDFYISAHTKPYGTAFGVLSLVEATRGRP